MNIASFPFQELGVNTSDAIIGGLAPGQTASIAVPQSIANLLPDGGDIRVAFTFYRDANLFPVMNSTSKNGQTVVGSSVISAQVNGIADGTKLDSPVSLIFVLNNAPVPGPNNTVSRSCAFWDFNAASELIYIIIISLGKLVILIHLLPSLPPSLPLHLPPDGSGNWNTSGCTLRSYNSTTNVAICDCNHLTNFACLVVSNVFSF